MSDDVEPLDEVDDALSLTIEYVEDVIEDLKAATQEAVRDERFDEMDRNAERVKQLRSFNQDVAGLLTNWRTNLVRSGAPKPMTDAFGDPAGEPTGDGDGTGPGSKQFYGRVIRGTKTPEAAFREPILRVLADAGGSMTVGACLDALESVMGERLNDVDRQLLASDGRTVRWRNTAQWCRNSLADLGLIDRSVRGTWTITDDGRTWLTRRG